MYILVWPDCLKGESCSEGNDHALDSVLPDEGTGLCAAVIDPGDAQVALAYCKGIDASIQFVLNTHAHFDHVAGNDELKRVTGCKVIGPETERIPGLDMGVGGRDRVEVGPWNFEVIETPGHTRNDICFFEPSSKALFCGDTLFAGGCGRLFEGTPDEMWESLAKIRDLPKHTQVFFGHEYTESNLAFTLDLLQQTSSQDNHHALISIWLERVLARLNHVRALRKKGGVHVSDRSS